MSDDLPLVKMYSDFKSPYAYLAFEPALDLETRYAVRVLWRPFLNRQRDAGERSTYSEYKYQYAYLDVRRWGRSRGQVFEPPTRIYDTTPALIGGLFAQRHGRLREFGREVFARFFQRRFEPDRPEAVAALLAEVGLSDREYLEYLSGAGPGDLATVKQEAWDDKVFGVPFFVFEGEHFWGNDRLAMLERRLVARGLHRTAGSGAAASA